MITRAMTNIEFRKLLANIFSGYNAYFGDNTGSFEANDYKINYQIISNQLGEGERIYIIDIDVWCKSFTRVDVIADELESILNYQSKEGWATFILTNRYNQDEKNISRRTLTYEVRTY